MEIYWLSLVPPVIVVIAAYCTKKLNISLFAGIFSAALIVAHGSFDMTFTVLSNRFMIQLLDIEKWYLYTFLLSIATFIVLFNHIGTAQQLATIIAKRIKTIKTIEFASLAISSLLLIDDYLSILTTGFIMLPLTEHYKITRQKLAFFVHSFAGPLVILAPISTWVGAITTYLQESGVSTIIDEKTIIVSDSWYLYLQAIPYIFYSFFIIASAICIIACNISYGPMAIYEENTPAYTPDLVIDHQETMPSPLVTIASLITPLLILIGTLLGGLLYNGNYYLFGGTNSFFSAIKGSHNLFFIMATAGILSLCAGLFIARARSLITVHDLPAFFFDGFILMKSAIIMVFLAGTLGYMLKNDLRTGQYLASVFLQTISIPFLPLMFFIASIIITIATGSAWATFAIMFAIAIPMISELFSSIVPLQPEAVPTLFPVLGAIFSGAVCGDHISPMSETTMMTGASTKCDPFTHAYTQFFYALPAIISTALAYLIIGLLNHYSSKVQMIMALFVGSTCCFILLLSAHKIHTMRQKK